MFKPASGSVYHFVITIQETNVSVCCFCAEWRTPPCSWVDVGHQVGEGFHDQSHHTRTVPTRSQDVSHSIKFIDPCASIKLKRSLIQKRIFWSDPVLSNSSKCTCKNEWLRNWNAKHFSERWPEIGSENWNKAQTAALSIYLLILDMRKSLCLWETFWFFL